MSNSIDAEIESLKAAANLPRHVAIIMDGNGRWASRRRLPRLAGHKAGREPVRNSVRTCARIGIPYLTLYTFSLENWSRPDAEVAGLMLFLEDILRKEYLELNENGVRLQTIGRVDMLPDRTRRALDDTIEKLSHNTRLTLTLALSYGARAEIIDAARALASDVKAGKLQPADIDEDAFRQRLYAPDTPDPDLLIRTSGEMRISNFLLWQIAYAEICVLDVFWPDFTEMHLINAIKDYLGRERRFGRSD